MKILRITDVGTLDEDVMLISLHVLVLDSHIYYIIHL